MPTATDFRNFAEACTRLSQTAESETSKMTLLSMAAKWTNIAAQAERVRQLVREADAVFNAPATATAPETEKPRLRARTTDKSAQAAHA
jgi:hypothetical protein